MTGPREPVLTRTPHLVALVAEAERLAAAVSSARPAASLVEEVAADAAVASLQLDGSPLAAPPDAALAGAASTDRVVGGDDRPRRGTWLDALRAGEVEDAQVTAVEYAGVRAALASDDLAGGLVSEPLRALAELHRRLTRGLLAPDRAGTPRLSDQAVHDASVGRVLYFPAEPAAVPTRLALLGSWLEGAAAREHALVVSGVVHLELLAIHPFEAANGRLARAAARLVLRARGLDPHGLAAAELALRRDPLGYHEEVARTLRRRDLTIWLERWGEAVTGGLRRSARRLGALADAVPDRAERFLRERREPRFTVVDYRAGAGVGPEESRADLERLLDAGRVRRVPGSRGLRYEVPTTN